MAHISTQEYWDIKGTGSADAKRSVTRKFKVIYDEIVDPLEVLNAPGIPTRWEPHPADASLLANTADATHLQSDPLIWMVEVEYSSLTGDEERGADDPRLRPTDIETDFITFQSPMLFDRYGIAVLNSAGDPHDPSWQMEDSRPVLRFSRFETDFDFARSLAYRNAINTDTFFGLEPGEVMCMYIKQRRHFENAIECWQTMYEFQGKSNGTVKSAGVDTPYNGWDAVIPDVGFNEIVSGNRVLILDNGSPRRPVSSPVRLNGLGVALDENEPFENTSFGVFKPSYRYLAFAALNLP